MEKEALLLIDIQDFYFDPHPDQVNKPLEASEKAAKLLEKFRQEGKTVIHVQHESNWLMDIHKSVTPLPDEKVVRKQHPSAFLGTELQEYLTQLEIRKLVVAGMMSHMCVETTVRDCQHYGYDVTLIEDACTTKNLEFMGKKVDAETVHIVSMAALNGTFAKVISLDEYM